MSAGFFYWDSPKGSHFASPPALFSSLHPSGEEDSRNRQTVPPRVLGTPPQRTMGRGRRKVMTVWGLSALLVRVRPPSAVTHLHHLLSRKTFSDFISRHVCFSLFPVCETVDSVAV